ncbi:hypothetical protein AB0L59_06730 [Streptomyces sp. NPDC052109]|uniref:hypothetical protein n=1 Tax=Streptomyces sp. NPDC052109 TaxID=3155527 RepID=UPI00341C1BA4
MVVGLRPIPFAHDVYGRRLVAYCRGQGPNTQGAAIRRRYGLVVELGLPYDGYDGVLRNGQTRTK